MKASYMQRPATIEHMPDGHTKLRFDIEEIATEAGTQFQCNEVNIPGALTPEKAIAAAIAHKWGNGVEQKLINDYNECLLGEGCEGAKDAYIAFLAERKALKQYIKTAIDEQI